MAYISLLPTDVDECVYKDVPGYAWGPWVPPTLFSHTVCMVGKPATVWYATARNPKPNPNPMVIGGSGGDVSRDGHTVKERRPVYHSLYPGCSFALETERKREEAWSGETMHASVLPSV